MVSSEHARLEEVAMWKALVLEEEHDMVIIVLIRKHSESAEGIEEWKANP